MVAIRWVRLLVVVCALLPVVGSVGTATGPIVAPTSRAVEAPPIPEHSSTKNARIVTEDTSPNESNSNDDLTSSPPPKTSGTLRNTNPNRNLGVRLDDRIPTLIDVVITLRNVSDARAGELDSMGADITARYGNRVEARINLSDLGMYRDLSWIAEIRRPYRAVPVTVSEGVSVINASDVHATGINGSGVVIGVIDTGFNLSNPEISDNIAGSRSFIESGDIAGDDPTHGTAAAEILVDTAPGVELYVANVDTATQYANAVQWLMTKDVEAISMSLGFPGQPFDGTGFASEIATNASRQGHAFIVAAGNSANAHWEGSYTDTDGDNWTEFAPGPDETNFVNLSGATSVAVYLTWDDWPSSDQDYDLYLYRHNASGKDTRIKQSTRNQTGTQEPVEFVTASLDAGDYYLAVSNANATGSHQLELYVFPTGSAVALEHINASSSLLAPATGYNVTTVGAVRYSTPRQVEFFSSRGPTNDGRIGIDVVAPDGVSTTTDLSPFFGTSAATPHVAGVITLLETTGPDYTTAELTSILTRTAVDIEDPGVDYRSGHGRVNALAAYQSGNIWFVNVTFRRTVVELDEELHGNVTIKNTATIDVETPLTIYTDGRVYNSQAVTIPANSTRRVGFGVTFDTVGNHSVTVDGLPSRTITVNRTQVRLDLTANRTEVIAERAVEFVVTREDTGERTNATLAINGTTIRTDSNGQVNQTFTTAGTFTVTASKNETSTTQFVNDTVNVTALPPGADLSIGSATGAPNETVRVPVSAIASNVSAYRMNVTFNASVLQVVNVTGVDFPDPTVHPSNTSGWVVFNATGTSTDNPTFANLVVKITVTRNTETTLSFVENETALFNTTGQEVFITRYNSGSVTVRVGPNCSIGDSNGDGAVNAGDAVVILRFSAGRLDTLPTPAECADANDDGAVNAGDAVVILRFSAGSISELPSP